MVSRPASSFFPPSAETARLIGGSPSSAATTTPEHQGDLVACHFVEFSGGKLLLDLVVLSTTRCFAEPALEVLGLHNPLCDLNFAIGVIMGTPHR